LRHEGWVESGMFVEEWLSQGKQQFAGFVVNGLGRSFVFRPFTLKSDRNALPLRFGAVDNP
jgi:hypothetical protein